MKVLEINAVCQFGSTGRNMVEIAEYLEENNIECCIAHSSDGHFKNEYIIGSSLNNKIHAILSRVTGWQEVYSIVPTLLLARYIKKKKFDIVNINNVHSNFISFPLIMSLLGRMDIPVVLTLHDCWFYTGKCTHYTRDKCFSWKDSCGNCPRLKKDIPSFFFDFTRHMLRQKEKAYRKMSKNLYVVGVSNWIANEAKKSILRNAAQITTIYNWVDIDIFRPVQNREQLREKYGISTEQKVLLGVAAGWTEDKGFSDYIKLSERLPDEYRILLVGENPTGFQNRNNIQVVGKTNSLDELVEYYNIADCFLSLSEEESFGKVVAESLSCGTPVIVYNSTASPELIEDGYGFVVEKHDIDELIEKIFELCELEKWAISDRCREYATKKFEKRKNINAYKELFFTAVNAKGEKNFYTEGEGKIL